MFFPEENQLESSGFKKTMKDSKRRRVVFPSQQSV